MQLQLNISGVHFELLRKHLYPGDGKEAVAVALCGRFAFGDLHRLLVKEIITIPHDECHRKVDRIDWSTERLIPLLEKASTGGGAILKIHSHPGGYEQFSSVDDGSDRNLFSSIFGWIDTDDPHGSAVMLPDGKIFGRFFYPDCKTKMIDQVIIAGDHINKWRYGETSSLDLEIGLRVAQAFGEKTYELLKQLKIGVIGCSGTGSIVVEQLTRLGVGILVIVDPDKVELKNLNRILNSKRKDVEENLFKVHVIKKAIDEMGLETDVRVHPNNLYDNICCLKELASCDVLFGCVDSVDGRDLINRLSTYYLLPYFDLGIKLEADGKGGASKIVGTVNYIQPGKSSLMSRGVYDAEDLKAAGLLRIDPENFQNLVKNSYIKNINVNRPAVISINMMVASHAVNEFLNRIHPYKVDGTFEYAQSTIDMTENCIINVSEKDMSVDKFLERRIGLGDRRVFLDAVEL